MAETADIGRRPTWRPLRMRRGGVGGESGISMRGRFGLDGLSGAAALAVGAPPDGAPAASGHGESMSWSWSPSVRGTAGGRSAGLAGHRGVAEESAAGSGEGAGSGAAHSSASALRLRLKDWSGAEPWARSSMGGGQGSEKMIGRRNEMGNHI